VKNWWVTIGSEDKLDAKSLLTVAYLQFLITLAELKKDLVWKESVYQEYHSPFVLYQKCMMFELHF
jgi:hypothetical protein